MFHSVARCASEVVRVGVKFRGYAASTERVTPGDRTELAQLHRLVREALQDIFAVSALSSDHIKAMLKVSKLFQDNEINASSFVSGVFSRGVAYCAQSILCDLSIGILGVVCTELSKLTPVAATARLQALKPLVADYLQEDWMRRDLGALRTEPFTAIFDRYNQEKDVIISRHREEADFFANPFVVDPVEVDVDGLYSDSGSSDGSYSSPMGGSGEGAAADAAPAGVASRRSSSSDGSEGYDPRLPVVVEHSGPTAELRVSGNERAGFGPSFTGGTAAPSAEAPALPLFHIAPLPGGTGVFSPTFVLAEAGGQAGEGRVDPEGDMAIAVAPPRRGRSPALDDILYIDQSIVDADSKDQATLILAKRRQLIKYLIEHGGMTPEFVQKRDLYLRIYTEGSNPEILGKLFQALTNTHRVAQEVIAKLRYKLVIAPETLYINRYMQYLTEEMDGPRRDYSPSDAGGQGFQPYLDPDLGTHIALAFAVACLQKYRVMRDQGVVDHILKTPILTVFLQNSRFDEMHLWFSSTFLARHRAIFQQARQWFAVSPHPFVHQVEELFLSCFRRLSTVFQQPGCKDLHVKHWANQLGLGLRKSHLKGPKLREAFLEALVTRNMEDIISALSAPGYLLYVQSNHHLPTLQRGDAIPANIHALTVSTVHDVEIGTIWNVIFRGNTFQGSFMHFAGDKKYRLIRSSLREVMTIGSGSEYCLLPGEFKAKVLGSTALPDPCADFAAKVKCRARIGQSISAVLIFAAIFGPLAIVYIVLYYLKGDEKAIAPTPPPGICDNHVNILVGPLVNGFCDFLATTSGPGGNSFYPNTYAQVGYQGNFSDYPSNWVLRPGNALTLINGAAGSLKTEVDCLNPVGCSGAMFPADEEGRSCEVRVPFTCGGTTSIPFVAALLQIARTVGSPTEMIAVSATLAVLSVAAYAVGRVVGPVVKSGFSAVFHQSSSEQSDELQPEGRV